MTETAPAPVVVEPPTAFTSPLTLILDEERTGGRNLEEALFLSFTADLGFFEEVALGVTQATGARVTVAGDVSMARNDPRSVRRAGRSYLAGLAYAQGAAFHPKLMVLAGPEHATIALGSGNTTLAGWQANAELWTVLRVDGEQSPTAVPDLSAWLRDLPERVRFSAGVPQALGRVAALLDRLHRDRTPAASQVRVVSSLRSPIIDQLPQGPVDELAVFAPFYDRRSMALRRLLERFRPSRFTLAYQPGLSDLDGPSVAALVKEYDGLVVSDNDQRYRHGKLVEWVSEGQRWALTGSPNLSAAALLLSQGDGGNCELGIIAPITATLLPDGSDEPAARLDTVPPLPRPIAGGGPLLLGALRVPDGLEISVARPLPDTAHLELSQAAAPPEAWERIADIPPGQATLTVTAPADAGSRVRLVVVDSDGVPSFGNIVFVVDPDRALRRLIPAQSQALTTRPPDLFADPRLAERFLGDLETLRTGLTPPQRAYPRAAALAVLPRRLRWMATRTAGSAIWTNAPGASDIRSLASRWGCPCPPTSARPFMTCCPSPGTSGSPTTSKPPSTMTPRRPWRQSTTPRQPVPKRAAPPPCPTSGRPTRKSAVDTGAGWSASSPSLPTWALRSACSSSG